MATYRYTNTTAASLKLNERPLYGSSRLGSLRTEVELHSLPSFDPTSANPVQQVDLNYELTDHLGNVCAVVTGRLLDGNGGGTPKQAELLSAQGYEAFGSLLIGMNFSSDRYRWGFGGQLKDDEIYGATGTSYTAEFWQYDTRTAQRWNIDPVIKPWESPYATFGRNPIRLIDSNGANATKYEDEAGNVIGETQDGINDIVTIGNEDLEYFKGMLRREQSLKNEAVNEPERNRQWAKMFGVATRPNPSPGMSIPTPDAQSVQFSLTGAIGAGISLDIGVAWTKEGDVSPIFAIGPAFGLDASAGVSHSQYWSYTGRNLTLDNLTGVGAEHSLGVLFFDAASGGDLRNNIGPFGGYLRDLDANKYYSESWGVSGGLPLGYSYKLKNTSLLR
jgi:hypothetical protein